MKIQSVAVLGVGAVGSYVIWGLSEKNNIKLGVIAEGERVQAIEALFADSITAERMIR